VFLHRSVEAGIWIGYLTGEGGTATPAEDWQQLFKGAGFVVSAVKTQSTASRFTFADDTYAGTAYVGVLCAGHLALEYQFNQGSKFGPQPASTNTPKRRRHTN
jgi:hypothetical protein